MSECLHLARRDPKLGLITKKLLRSLLGLIKGPTKGLLQDYLTERSLQQNADMVLSFLTNEQLCDWEVLCPVIAMALPRTGFVRCDRGSLHCT